MHEWDDIRYFLAVAREGGLSGAARQLGVNHSTVFRRIQALEERLDARLFERLPGGYSLTAAGEEMLDGAARVEAEMAMLDRQLAGRDLRLSGSVRLTTPDDIAEALLPQFLIELRRRHPGITVEVNISNTFLNLSRREADVALRPSSEPPETMMGRRLSTIAFALYAGQDYCATTGLAPGAVDLAAHALIQPDDSLATSGIARWWRRTAPDARPALQSSSFAFMARACRAGLGIALLPCLTADRISELVRLSPPEPSAASELWLLTHPDLRRAARIRAVMALLAEAVETERDLLEGRRGT